MIDARPYDDLAAMAVLRRLDLHDLMEIGAQRGAAPSHLSLFADWHGAAQTHLANWVIYTAPNRGAIPFAVMAVAHTGQAGVAAGALLARDHGQFRRELWELAMLVRAGMPHFCARLGVRRIEARSWAGHPMAARFLQATGFRHECDMPGFGGDGRETFRQFAYVPPCTPEPAPPTETTPHHQP